MRKRVVYSQNGEDGIIEKIFEELNITKKSECFGCEFGASDGVSSSNSLYILENFPKFKCLLIEANSNKYRRK